MLKKIIHIFFLTLSFSTFSQQKNVPLNQQWNLELEKKILADTTFYSHTQFKPLIENISIDHSYPTFIKKDSTKSLFFRKVKRENLFIVKDTSDKFYLTIDPLFNFEFGKDLEDSLDEKLYRNTRGLLIRGDIGNRVSFESSFYENQSTFPEYIDNFNDTFLVVPGQGRWKQFKTRGYDYAMASGYISYSAIKRKNTFLNIQLGHGKHFIGEGYRSLLLSDNAFNYPYFRITTQYKNLQYTNLYAIFMNLNDGGVTTPANTETLFQKKGGSFQLLNWNIHKRFQLGLFQGMIWEAADNHNRQQLDFFYFNPVIFTHLIKYSLRHTNNILLGSTLKLKLTNHIFFYGQYMLDDIATDLQKGSLNNKHGFQAGGKYFDAFTLPNLQLQMEYNQVRPYTYAHKKADQSYTHYNQPLAHPLGANFKEIIGLVNYRIKDFSAEIKINYALIGKDSTGKNQGNNIFNSDKSAFYGVNSTLNTQNQGLATTLTYFDAHISYLINPSTNMNIVIGISKRQETTPIYKHSTNYLYISLRTALSNFYYDF